MSRIFRQSDRIELNLGDVEVKVKPLSYAEKTEIQSLLIEGQRKASAEMLTEGTVLSLRYALKSITGLKDSNDEDYKLEFDDTGKVSMNCVEDLMNTQMSDKLLSACASFISGIPTDEDLEKIGVSFQKKTKTKKKK